MRCRQNALQKPPYKTRSESTTDFKANTTSCWPVSSARGGKLNNKLNDDRRPTTSHTYPPPILSSIDSFLGWLENATSVSYCIICFASCLFFPRCFDHLLTTAQPPHSNGVLKIPPTIVSYF
ncbi:hypothetical protein ACQRIT_006055 [Beauveria bassiana]